jgi:hypothetical protein
MLDGGNHVLVQGHCSDFSQNLFYRRHGALAFKTSEHSLGGNYIIVPRGPKYGQKIFRGLLRVYRDLLLACENQSLL